MPRRRVLTDAQLEDLLALPATEPALIRYWTLSSAEIAAIQRRRRDRNRLGFALQLCALRYPGRLLRPGECIPPPALHYVAHQLDLDPEALAAYAARFQTHYEQIEALRETFGFIVLERPRRRELLAWLLPVALATTSVPAIAAALMDELRRRQFIVPGPSIIERMVATAVLLAERRVASQLTRDLRPEQTASLDALLRIRDGAPMSVLACRPEHPATAPSPDWLSSWPACEGSALIRQARQACIPRGCASLPARVGASPPSTCAP